MGWEDPNLRAKYCKNSNYCEESLTCGCTPENHKWCEYYEYREPTLMEAFLELLFKKK